MKNKALPVFISILLAACFILSFTATAAEIREGDNTDEPADTDAVVALEGTYATVDEETKQAILARINEIRKEACDEGVPYPGNRSVNLTPDDYVPIKWSTLVEKVAAMRAAEASIYINHGRLTSAAFGNPSSVFTNGYGVRTFGENLAWNWGDPDLDGILFGINQWYGEKEDWIEGTPDAVTGHYTSMINPAMTYIGISAFYNPVAMYRLTVANQLSGYGVTLDEDAAGIGGEVYQKICLSKDFITGIELECEETVKEGQTVSAKAKVNVTVTTSGRGLLISGANWISSDDDVATVDENGVITGVSAGTATITAIVQGDVKASVEITVLSDEPEQVIYGDVNGDGTANNKDVVALFKYVNGSTAQVNEEALDCNGDGQVNNKDVVVLFKYVSA